MALPSSAEEELSCPVCCELFVDKHTPIILDCRHDVCKVCLKILVKNKTVNCPQCRAPTAVKAKLSSMKPNYRVRNLAEIYAKCGHEKDDEERCAVHIDQKSIFVCVSCNVLVCQFCLVHNHQDSNHHCKERKEVVTERKQQYSVFLDQARVEMQWCNRATLLWDERRVRTTTSFERERSNVADHERCLVECVQQRRTDIVHKLNQKEHCRLEVIAMKMETCQKAILSHTESGGEELYGCQYDDLFNMINEELKESDVSHNLQPERPDTRRPFVVSRVDLGTHPHSIDLKSITENSIVNTTGSDLEESARVDCVRLADTQAGQKRCQEAVDAWLELREKVTASLYEEVSKISRHSREMVDEIKRQGDLIKQELRDEEGKRLVDIESECDRCRQRVKRLQTLCDDITGLSDTEYVTKYKDVIDDMQRTTADNITFPEKETDAPKLISRNIAQYVCLGYVVRSKNIYVRKQLVTQFGGDATIIGIDASKEGHLVLAGRSASGIGSLQVWSGTMISGSYQRIIATEVCGKGNITGITFDITLDRYHLSRTSALESYSALGIYESTLLVDCGTDDGHALNIQSAVANGEGLVMIGDIQTRTITVFNFNDNCIDQVIPVPFQPYKIATYGRNVVYTDVVSDKVHCVDYISQSDVFTLTVPSPTGICFDKSTSCLYICKVNQGNATIDLHCGFTGDVKEENVLSGFVSPQDLCLLNEGKELAVADGSDVKIYCMK